MACCTLVIFSACSSGISHSNSSSRAITSSTLSRESAPRSSTKDDSFLMSASATPSCSATIFLTRASMFSIDFLQADSVDFVRSEKRVILAPFTLESLLRIAVANGHGGTICRSIHEHAAIYVQSRASYVRSSRGTQEEHCLGDVVDPPQATQRHVFDEPLDLVL